MVPITKLLKHLVQYLFRAHVLRIGRLGRDAVPELIVYRESRLDDPFREQIMDVVLTSAVVAGVDADAFAKKLLDHGFEGRAVTGQLQTLKCHVGGLQATGQRGSKISVRGVNALIDDELLPEVVGSLCLLDAELRERSVVPGGRVVAVDLSPVALLCY